MSLVTQALTAFSNAEPVAHAPKAEVLPRLKALVQADMQRVNATISEQLTCEEPLIRTIGEHILQAGGKRLRPSLTLASARLCGYTEGDRHVRLASAVELIHTATLLHDDVVDESRMRRGLATANELWGNKTSVLVGDFLLSRAFQLMVADGNLQVLKLLSDVSAIISQGEVMQQTTACNPETEEADYFRVIEAKTASLFAAGCQIGAVVANTPQHEATLHAYGMQLGIAFQIMDDALDYAAETEALGKAVGDDFREGKITLPVILAYADGSEEERQFWQRCLRDLDQHAPDLAHAQALLERHNAIRRSLDRARSIAADAKAQLNAFPPSPAKDALLEVADFSVARAY